MFAALVGAIAWNYLTWWVGMPSSSSHAMIGGLSAPASPRAARGDHLGVDEAAVIAIFVSPMVAFTMAFVTMVGLSRFQQRLTIPDDARISKGCRWCRQPRSRSDTVPTTPRRRWGSSGRSCWPSGYMTLQPDGTLQIDWWIPFLAYSAIAIGTVWGGWKIIETMGLRITSLRASSGLAANIGAVTAIFGATGMGIPISTTHAAASSVTGAGVASGQGVNLRVVRRWW